MLVKSGEGLGARKQQSLAPRLTTEQDMTCTDQPSLQDRHTTAQACLLPSLGSTHRWPLPPAPEPGHPGTYQGVDGFGPVLGLHSTQGAAGQAVRGGRGEQEEASSQHQPLPRHSVSCLPAGKGGEEDNEICDRPSWGAYPGPAVFINSCWQHCTASILAPTLQRPREAWWLPKAKGQVKELTRVERLCHVLGAFPHSSH